MLAVIVVLITVLNVTHADPEAVCFSLGVHLANAMIEVVK